MSPIKASAPPILRSKPIVKGPIRCHKCQLMCLDAEQYLNHACQPREAPVVNVSRR